MPEQGSPDMAHRAALVRNRWRRANPSTLISNELIVDGLVRFLADHFSSGAESVLDLGAGTKPYAAIYESVFDRCVAVDVGSSPHDIAGVDLIADAASLPFEDATFDCVICTEVLEHCPDPRLVLKEIRRMLKPGGRVYLTTPFLVGLHEMPYDYFRFAPPALTRMSQEVGLACDSITPRGDRLGVTLLMMQFSIAKPLQRLRRLGGGWYSYANPLVFVLVAAPQHLYLRYWRRANTRPQSMLGRLARRLDGSTLGYITCLHLPDPDVVSTGET